MRVWSSSAGLSASLLATAFFAPHAAAYNFTDVPSPYLDVRELGRVALTGNFDALSIYQWEGQEQSAYYTNGSQSILARYPNDAFAALRTADAHIEAMCPFIKSDGTLAGIFIGGNFTSLGGVETQGVGLFNPDTAEVTAVSGLTGRVQALYCDGESGTVYVGGTFSGGNSTNAIAWNGDWENMPFAGFNGPVASITKAPNGNIIFGGSFHGIGNTTTPTEKDQQVVPLAAGNITSSHSTSTDGFKDPKNIICKVGSQDGSGNSWLLEDNTAGYWEGRYQFEFQPTKMRLYNTKHEGRGTKTFRFTAFPINGIMNFTHIDAKGNNITCDARCPLPEGNTTYQDFHFVNSIGMDGFRIDVSDWWGDGGGLAGIELFQDEIFAFAINTFNEPTCDSVSTAANSTTTGPWKVTPSHESSSGYLTANFTGQNTGTDSAGVVFKPNIKQSGNYTVRLYTPGCLQDNTCDTRGIVNITGTMTSHNSSGTTNDAPVTATLYETNYYDKYDTIYSGYIDAIDGTWRPSVTLTPANGQSGNVTIVAQRVRFELMSDNAGGLNGIYEYNPKLTTVSDDYSSSAFDAAGISFEGNADITSMAVGDNAVFIGGNFTNGDFSNIFKVSDNASVSLSGNGLDNEVHTLYLNETAYTLYVGGNFSKTVDGSVTGLGGVAAYSLSDDSWTALGAGVLGTVSSIVPFTLNLTAYQPEEVIAVSGDFARVAAFDDNDAFAVDGIAIWSPSRKNWVHNLGIGTIGLAGKLTAWTNVTDAGPFYAGSVSSQALGASGAVGLNEYDNLALQSYNLSIQPRQSAPNLAKRDALVSNYSGIVTGTVYDDNGLNLTIVGGHFTATGSNGTTIHNLLFMNSSSSEQVTGLTQPLNDDATILSLGTVGTTLYAGGTFSGNVSDNEIDGLLAYNLATNELVDSQPQALSRDEGTVSVNAVAPRPKTTDLFIGGDFDSAGAFGCPGLCVLSTDRGQWTNPGSGFGGSVYALTWTSQNTLMIGGNLTIQDVPTTLATYNAKKKTFQAVEGADSVPGPVSAITAANLDATQFWIAGTATNGSAFVMLSGTNAGNWFTASSGLGEGTVIRGLQVFSTSEKHDSSDNMNQDKILMALGSIHLPDFGQASAAVFNGTSYQPFILSTSGNGQGSMSQIFVQHPQNVFKSSHGHLAVGLIVLISLAISLGLIMLIVVAGIIAERIRRKREGYVPAPQMDKGGNMSRIPPEHILGNLDNPGQPERL
ncbi:uncharacterized protein K452DRAFT_219281 [Aplosporella prunicola CBS 121167]|uniref:Cellular morphogenesis protein n=1 Tax=Aplosporella prunicola CBS 121167 TaxID=1176127 RepID=A0A6A6BSS3_9PEZI|nr:uncharacterized protein K452DRAFT_219281 [Aplosporella prunicola CBS 121167]KAF2146838.1 hypothetical protein K452DRAFT_219281 [Aplosporella prunicola CBS 121167]